MKIALLTDGIYPFTIGGMQKHSYYLAKFLARQGVQLDVIIPPKSESSNSELEDYLTSDELDNLNFIEVDEFKGFYFPGHYIYESYKYSENIYNEIIDAFDSYDFIYAQGFTAWKLIKEKKNSNIVTPPIGVNFHGMEAFQTSANIKSKLEKILLSYPMQYCIANADFVFSLGGKLTSIVKQITGGEDNIFVTPIGIEDKWISDNSVSQNGVMNYVFIGRYERRKGIEELHETIKKLSDKYNFKFDFIGPIPDSKRLKQENVHYHGAVYGEDKIMKILDNKDILVCPSYSEGMPTVILEAMARGLAIIATDVGAVNCLVSDDTGWLISPGSSTQLEEAFVQSLTIDKNQLIEKKKSAQKLIAEEYLWDKIAAKNLEEIKRINT